MHRNVKINPHQVLMVFFHWLKNNRNASVTSQKCGIQYQRLLQWIRNGYPSFHIPPFAQLAETFTNSELLELPELSEFDMKRPSIKWSPQKRVAENIKICAIARRKVLTALQDQKLKISSIEDALRAADMILKLERAIEKDAKQLNMVEPSDQQLKSEQRDEQKRKIEELPEEELRKVIALDRQKNKSSTEAK